MSNGTVHALNQLKDRDTSLRRVCVERDALKRRVKVLERLCAKVWNHGLLTAKEFALVEELCGE